MSHIFQKRLGEIKFEWNEMYYSFINTSLIYKKNNETNL